MSDIREDLQKELDKITIEEEKKDDSLSDEAEKIVETLVKETSKRLTGGTSGKVAVVLATLLIALNNVAVGWLQGEGVLTSDAVLTLLIGFILVVIFQILTHINNFISLRIHKKDIELDIEELKIDREKSKIGVEEMREKEKIMLTSERARRREARADMKFKQDLSLRDPLYRDAQQSMMEFFARDDIIHALKVPPTFADAIKKMDDALLQRTDVDLTLKDVTEKFSVMLQRYEAIQFQVKETAHILDTVVQTQSTHTIKYRELEVSIQNMQGQVEGISNAMQNLMQILDARLPANELVSESEEEGVKVRVSVKTEPLQDEIDELVDKLVEKEEEKKNTESTLSPPPS